MFLLLYSVNPERDLVLFLIIHLAFTYCYTMINVISVDLWNWFMGDDDCVLEVVWSLSNILGSWFFKIVECSGRVCVVMNSKEKGVAETMHHLTLEIIVVGKKKLYEAEVNFKESHEFKSTNDDSPTITPSYLSCK